MKALVLLDTRFDRTPDGRVWSDSALNYTLWQRYLDVFDAVRVLARMREVPQVGPQANRADGPRVTFVRLPHYVGPWQFLRRCFAVRSSVRAALQPGDAVILRVPNTAANLLQGVLRSRGQPYAVEVIGDPFDVFGPGSVRSVLRPWARQWYTHHLRRQCSGAVAVSYVAAYLQRRYPPALGALAVACHDGDLPDEAFVSNPRPALAPGGPFRLLLVGCLEQLYKAPDVLIRAVAANLAAGFNLDLTIVGEGRHRSELEALARQCGVADRVRFAGLLPAGLHSVRAALDHADLFVLASRAEGLPRALVEAMARALPCVASTVGGIPELLPAEDLVCPGDVAALTAKLREVLSDPQRMAHMSARNLAKAREYRADNMRIRRRRFYEHVRDMTAEWQRRTQPSLPEPSRPGAWKSVS